MKASVQKIQPDTGLYDTDYHLWAMRQATLLRDGRLAELDLANLAEELEDLGRSQKNEVRSRFRVLLTHLLKWRYQPSGRSSSWKGTIVEQRIQLADLIADNPSLAGLPAEQLARIYRDARAKAAAETGLAEEAFPPESPFTAEQSMRAAFWPPEQM